jgi:hypothetical protein
VAWLIDNVNIVAAFDEDFAARLSGVSKSQLSYWYRSGESISKRIIIYE